MADTGTPVNIFEFEALAKELLPKAEYDFIAGGAADEITVTRNRAAFDSILLRPRTLVDIAQRDVSTTVLGQRIEFPVMLAPAGGYARAHPEGELAAARVSGSLGIGMLVSSAATYSLEAVSAAATGPIWFQHYLFQDREVTRVMAQRAEEAGYTALFLTLDAKVPGKRERNLRNLYSTGLPAPNYPESNIGAYARSLAGDWSELDWLAANTSLPVCVKGIMTGEDARLCAEHGVKGAIVSNHGGRQLDSTFSTIEVLPEVVDAVDGRLEVYLDGGIRRGTDVLKALALGARAVFIGRPLYWGLAVDGESGLRAVLQMLRDELDLAMAMCGRPTIDSIDISLLGTVSPLVSVLQHPEGLQLPRL